MQLSIPAKNTYDRYIDGKRRNGDSDNRDTGGKLLLEEQLTQRVLIVVAGSATAGRIRALTVG